MMPANLKKDERKIITFESTRFGTVEVAEDRVICFAQGIIGFPDIKQYVLLDQITNTPFIWLHAVDTPSLCFLVADPHIFKSDYVVSVGKKEREELGASKKTDLLVMAIVTSSSDIARMSINLKGPLVINTEQRTAKQIVLINEEYPTRHPIFSPDCSQSLPPQKKVSSPLY